MMDVNRLLPVALRTAYLALHRRSEARFAELGVTADQFILLDALAQDNALTQRELARRIASDPSTVRAMLVLLAKCGLVRRDDHPTDARARTVTLTPMGKRKYKQLWAASEEIRSTMRASLTSEESQSLVGMLSRIEQSLNPKPSP